ncbi:MAG: DUF5665 domain-containing protein [bacterium]
MAENESGINQGVSGEAGRTEVFHIPEPSREFKLDVSTINNLSKLSVMFERMNLTGYLSMMQNTRLIIWNNFIAGVARGFGFSIGMTLLVGLLLFLMGRMVDIPLIGKYIAKIVEIVQMEMKMRKF